MGIFNEMVRGTFLSRDQSGEKREPCGYSEQEHTGIGNSP